MRVRVQPPMRPSASARIIAKGLGALTIRRRDSRYRSEFNDVVVNWGNPQQVFRGDRHYWINDPLMVRRAIDKEWAWNRWQERGVPTVEHSAERSDAFAWLREGDRLLVRTSLRGTQGRGISVYSMAGTDWTQDAYHFDQLGFGHYVKVFGRNPAHVTEYRVHVMGGQVIDFVQKKRRRDYEGRPHPYVRSWDNGWVFAREEVQLPEVADEASVKAVAALGLDFGAVDIGVSRDGHACVYEVNTAPGIEGTTIDAYLHGVRQLIAAKLRGVRTARG